MANRGYLEWAHKLGFVGSTAPIVLQLYSEPLQKFRLAAQGHGAYQPPAEHRERVAMYFDPLPIWYEAFESAQVGGETHPLHSPPLEGEGVSSRGKEERTPPFPLHAITQRPMFMYHSWGSQNAWLRQITARTYLYLRTAEHTSKLQSLRRIS